tara:strand:+ start:380 stop:883 length:504 start_codon:yes stop_codon:yes gene_type:complete
MRNNHLVIQGYGTLKDRYLRPALLGAVDGLITSFVIVAGGLASETEKSKILLIGFSSLIADGISMGVSESISSRAQGGLPLGQTALLGLVCLTSFVIVGCFPLVGFAAGATTDMSRILSIALFAFFLFAVGVVRSCITRENCALATAETVALGSIAGAIAYAIASIR